MRSGKHAQARLSHYIGAHVADLERLNREGFIQSGHHAEFQPVPGGFLFDADVRCEGGILITARKLARVVHADPENPEVETAWYSYHVSLQGVGNIVRYDSPSIPDMGEHHAYHHVHRYDLLNGDQEGAVEIIEDEESIPHLGDVIREAQEWFFANLDALRERGFV